MRLHEADRRCARPVAARVLGERADRVRRLRGMPLRSTEAWGRDRPTLQAANKMRQWAEAANLIRSPGSALPSFRAVLAAADVRALQLRMSSRWGLAETAQRGAGKSLWPCVWACSTQWLSHMLCGQAAAAFASNSVRHFGIPCRFSTRGQPRRAWRACGRDRRPREGAAPYSVRGVPSVTVRHNREAPVSMMCVLVTYNTRPTRSRP